MHLHNYVQMGTKEAKEQNGGRLQRQQGLQNLFLGRKVGTTRWWGLVLDGGMLGKRGSEPCGINSEIPERQQSGHVDGALKFKITPLSTLTYLPHLLKIIQDASNRGQSLSHGHVQPMQLPQLSRLSQLLPAVTQPNSVYQQCCAFYLIL
ncbi:uncharacterized protein LOC108628939 [Ceratina calcarata]|uniref:Uncharacterized protein LOC108628939 n=1 Tax=Ceratina calcarata TaxID=156304 RepID=A0AAJ7J8L7_9HYME|nr:uncharacterized protein LOC108628939 [Ceratina calcarata]